jgi:hypothetical protein
MKIYVCHTTSFDYQQELYRPLKQSSLNKEHQIILPHFEGPEMFDSKSLLPSVNLVVAEVSFLSTSMGIEIGWANMLQKPIVFIYKESTKPSRSLKAVSENFIEYANSEDMVQKLQEFIQGLKTK